MSLDLGAVIGRAILDTTSFDAKYTSLLRRMSTLGGQAGRAAGGVRRLDTSLYGAGTAAGRAGISLDKMAAASKRAGASSTQAAGATQRQAAGANRLAEAQARVAGIMSKTAGQSARNRILALREMAAQQRLAAAHSEAGSAAARQAQLTARLAETQAAALGAAKRLGAAQALSSASLVTNGKKMSRAFTVPIVAAGAVAIHEAAQFEQATNVYVTAAGESVKNLGVIRDGIKGVAMETGTSIDNLTDAEYVLQKAGYRGADGIKVLDASAKGAREENARLADVVQAMTSIMSAYNLPASKSVQVMNALKTGAGSAKVSMEDYTRALSTVLPIASANKISLSDLLGAYSQLTQAGNTAQYSTQLLSSTIRAMAAPNRVAQKQMQQLGLDVNDVTSKIGQRGLSGTIRMYTEAIAKKMGPSGLVVQNAFNQQASAMEDVNIMLAKMPAQVRNLSKNYQDGKITFKDWRDQMKGLPTDQAAMAKNFASVSDRTHAFNDLLKAGDPAAQTFTSTLRKMTNGAIGMNTILQLMGDNFKGVDARSKAVGKSLANTDHEVEGWHSTAELASVKADQLKESMHVLAIDGGNALLPMFKSVVDGATDMVHGFQGLDSSQKQILGWSLGIMAAIGPIMFIGGKLRAAGGRIVSAMNFIAGGANGAATRTSVAMARMGIALGGAGIGFAVGSMTKNASGGAKALGVLGSAAAGAALGMAGGGLGAAIGGIAGGLSALIASWGDEGDAAEDASKRATEATAAQHAEAQELLGVLQQVNGAYGEQTRTSVAAHLQKTGDLKKYADMGIKPQDLISAALGDEKAYGRANDQLTRFAQGKYGKDDVKHINELHDALYKVVGVAADAEESWQLYKQGVNQTVTSTAALAKGSKTLAATLGATKAGGLGLGTGGDSAYAKRNQQVLKEYGNHARDVAAKKLAQGASITSVTKAYQGEIARIKEIARAQGLEEEGIQRTLEGYGLLPSKINTLALAYSKLPKRVITNLKKVGVKDADINTIAGAYKKLPKSVRTELKKTGTSPAEIVAILAKYKLLPRSVITALSANPASAQTKIAALKAQIRSIRQSTSPLINANTALGQTAIAGLQAQIDALTGKNIDIGVGIGVNIKTTGKLPKGATLPKNPLQSIFGANGMVLKSFLHGGINKPGREDHIAQVAKAGDWRVWAEDETGGESYIPHAKSKRARSRKILEQTARILGGVATFKDGGITHEGKDWIYDGTKYASKRAAENAQTRAKKGSKKERAEKAQSAVQAAIGSVGQAPSSPIDLSSLGYTRVMGQIRRASDVLSEQIRKGLTGKAEKQARAQLASLRKDANRQLDALRVKIKTSDLAEIKKALNGTAEDVRTAFDTVITDARNAGADKKTIGVLTSGRDRLIRKQAQIIAARERLDTMKEYNSGVKETLSGNVDVSKFGSIEDFVGGLGDAAGTNNSYARQVASLTNRVKGNAGLTALVEDLASKGNSAGLESLAGSSAAELAQVAKAYAGYASSLGAGGDAATRLKFGTTVGGQESSIKTLVADQTALVTAVGQVAALLPQLANRPQRWVVGGKEITASVIKDPQFDAEIARVTRALTGAKKRGRRG